jgi:CBS domain containing-hemolysin-like protein
MQEKVREEARQVTRGALALAALLGPSAAHASFLSGEALDTAANALSWFILFAVPIVAVGAFFYVHVLPELIAERRQHPHKDSIKVLCILSLFFGGLLWPFAWLWAYTKPIGYRAIYGTERHEDYYLEMGEKARSGKLDPAEVDHLREELAMMASKVTLSPALKQLAAELDAISAARKAAAPAPVPRGAE